MSGLSKIVLKVEKLFATNGSSKMRRIQACQTQVHGDCNSMNLLRALKHEMSGTQYSNFAGRLSTDAIGGGPAARLQAFLKKEGVTSWSEFINQGVAKGMISPNSTYQDLARKLITSA